MGCCISENLSKEENKESEKIKISISDFDIIKVIGKGSYGKVFLVRKKSNSKLYAMKRLKKEYLKIKNQQEHTKSERKLLEIINYNFIVNFYYAFQDEKYLYIITEFMQGGELFFHLYKETFFDNEKVKFYTAEIILALQHLHNKNMIYRDLKPENILLGKDGHIKLTDFGLCKILNNKKKKTYTICGTPQYIAPEIFNNKGYDSSVDWWSLGCLTYEMLIGYPPFKFDKNNFNVNIFNNEIIYPNSFTDEAKLFLKDILIVDPNKRLGSGKNGIENIKKHPFFNGINWEDLENKKVIPPFIPNILDDTDLGNFDKCFTREKINESEIDGDKIDESNYPNFTYMGNISNNYES